jgi:beta-mannosidase
MIDLAGRWTLRDCGGRHSVAMTVPGDGHSALVAAGVIPDPYVGRNEETVRWVAEQDWILSRSFDYAGETEGALIVLDCIDTVAEVAINGMKVHEAASSFVPQEVLAGPALRQGENLIEVRFPSAIREAVVRQAAQPFPVPYHKGNCPIPNGNMLRKVQCDFGWDWGPALVPFGIYGRAVLLAPGDVRLARPEVRYQFEGQTLHVVVTVQALSWLPGPDEVSVTFGDVTEDMPLVWQESTRSEWQEGIATVEFRIARPRLWWPNGMGAPHLYPLSVRVGSVRHDARVAVRTIEHVSEPDAAGRSFRFHVNGHDVFCRGANWIPADALPGRITAERTRALLESAAAANMNMIRVWGGGRYEPDSFYEACDELGLLVWQDFMFACHLYPSDDAFLDIVAEEAATQVRRLAGRVALWCGDNELVGALNWYDESRADRDRYLVAYDRLNRTLEGAVRGRNGGVREGQNWWPSSPSAGPLSFGDAWHDDSSGDMHFWSVWHEGRDFDHYRSVKPRFCSEFGFQSYPSMAAVRSFAGPDDLNIASPVMESHQKNTGGNARIAETMFRYFRFPNDFSAFVYLSQVQQGLAIKTAVTQWRSLKPHCMGTLYWQLNDVWPCASWASLDYGGNWKLLHHMARHFFAPVTVVAVPRGDKIAFVAVNDTLLPVELELTIIAAATNGHARLIARARGVATVDAAVTLATVCPRELRPDEVFVFHWQGPDGLKGGDHFATRPYKALDLRPSGLACTSSRREGGWCVKVRSQALSVFSTLESSVPGRFTDNAFLLFPDHPVEIGFRPDDPDGPEPVFTLRDLHSATYGAAS